MPLYHVTITLGNERAVIAVDHVLQEYGVSEQEMFCTWFVDRPEIQGDGDTLEQALSFLFNDMEEWAGDLSDISEFRHQFYKSTKQSRTKFRMPIIGDAGG
jgi:hypothetical protein